MLISLLRSSRVCAHQAGLIRKVRDAIAMHEQWDSRGTDTDVHTAVRPRHLPPMLPRAKRPHRIQEGEVDTGLLPILEASAVIILGALQLLVDG